MKLVVKGIVVIAWQWQHFRKTTKILIILFYFIFILKRGEFGGENEV